MIIYGYSSPDAEFAQVAHETIMQQFDKTKYDLSTERGKELASNFVSRLVAKARKEFRDAGVEDLFYYEPSQKRGVGSKYHIELINEVVWALYEAYKEHDERGTRKGVEGTILAKTRERAELLICKQLAKVPPDESKDYFAQTKSTVGRVDKHAQRLIDAGDSLNLRYLTNGTLSALFTRIRNYSDIDELKELETTLKRLLYGLSTEIYGHAESESIRVTAPPRGGGAAGAGLGIEIGYLDLSQTQEFERLGESGTCDSPTSSDEKAFDSRLLHAKQMLLAFRGTNLHELDVCWLDETTKKAARYKYALSAEEVENKLVEMLLDQEINRHSIALRPRAKEGFTYLQLDDLTGETIKKLKAYAFIAVQTSDMSKKPTAFQAWLCLENCGKSVLDELKQRLGADYHATGSVRMAGSINFKKTYDPDFPTVAVTYANCGQVLTIQDLKQHGFLPDDFEPSEPGEAVEKKVTTTNKNAPTKGNKIWPDYASSLKGAARKANDEPDRSDADFRWCCTCWHWGFRDKPEVIKRLMQYSRSNKIVAQREEYAKRTVDRAFDYAEKHSSQSAAKGRAKTAFDFAETKRFIQKNWGGDNDRASRDAASSTSGNTDNQLSIDFADAEDARQNDDLEPQPLRAGAISGFDFEEDEAELPDSLFSAENTKNQDPDNLTAKQVRRFSEKEDELLPS